MLLTVLKKQAKKANSNLIDSDKTEWISSKSKYDKNIKEDANSSFSSCCFSDREDEDIKMPNIPDESDKNPYETPKLDLSGIVKNAPFVPGTNNDRKIPETPGSEGASKVKLEQSQHFIGKMSFSPQLNARAYCCVSGSGLSTTSTTDTKLASGDSYSKKLIDLESPSSKDLIKKF